MDEYEALVENHTVDVQIRVSFTKIYDIDTINQRFQAEAIIESKWHDANIKTINDDVSKLQWKPDLYIENLINDPKEEINYKAITDKDTNSVMVCEIRKVKGLFWENLELENFPLDIQDLSLIVATKKSGKKVNFTLMQPELNRIKITHTLDKSMWYLHEIVKTSHHKIERDFSFGKREYPAVRLSCQAFRLPGYFYWNAILPIVLITFAALGPFVIDFKLPQSRLPSTATMLLSSVSFKAAATRLLPTVSYLTSLDKFCLGSIVIISAMLIYHAFMAAFTPILCDLCAYGIDKIAFLAFSGAIIFKQVLYGGWLFKLHTYREKLIRDGTYHESIQSNDILEKDKKLN